MVSVNLFSENSNELEKFLSSESRFLDDNQEVNFVDLKNEHKILKDKKGPKYDVARSKYVEFVFAGYEDLSALSGAISMFLELIHDADDAVFSNSLLADVVFW